jgi:hypothetical protein
MVGRIERMDAVCLCMMVGGAATGELDNVRSLRPIRVLVAGRDARYVRATTFLLARSGYETRRVRHARSLVRDPRVEAADVVVIEGEVSPEAAAAEAATLISAFPQLAVVVAVEWREPSADGRLQFVEKWAELDELVAAVNRAWASLGPSFGRWARPEVEAPGKPLHATGL